MGETGEKKKSAGGAGPAGPTNPANPAGPAADASAAGESRGGLEGGTYDVIRKRLESHGRQLRERLEGLNVQRRQVFGAIETALVASARVTTENNCVPRDMVAVGNRFIFGYNVFIGLRSETRLSDVFAVYEHRDHTFVDCGLELLRSEERRVGKQC